MLVTHEDELGQRPVSSGQASPNASTYVVQNIIHLPEGRDPGSSATFVQAGVSGALEETLC
jgi:hypothetical protein